jgi:hypothetical protein
MTEIHVVVSPPVGVHQRSIPQGAPVAHRPEPRRRIITLLSRRGPRDQPIAVHMDLDDAAQAELDRRKG